MSLVISLFRQDNEIAASAYETPQQNSAAGLLLNACDPIADGDIARRCAQVLKAWGNVVSTTPDRLDALRSLGEDLAIEFLPEQVIDVISASEQRDLLVEMPTELIGIPWELFVVDGQFLAERFNIGRRVRVKQSHRALAERSPHEQPSLQVAVIADVAGERETARIEGQLITDALDKSGIATLYRHGPLEEVDVTLLLSKQEVMLFASNALFTPLGQISGGGIEDVSPEREHLEKLLRANREYLQQLELKAAQLGVLAPPSIQTELEKYQKDIARIEDQVTHLKEQRGGGIIDRQVIDRLTKSRRRLPAVIIANSRLSEHLQRRQSAQATDDLIRALLEAGVACFIEIIWEAPSPNVIAEINVRLVNGLFVQHQPVGEALRNALSPATGMAAWVGYELYGDPSRSLFHDAPPSPPDQEHFQEQLIQAFVKESQSAWVDAEQQYTELLKLAGDAGLTDLIRAINDRLISLRQNRQETADAIQDMKKADQAGSSLARQPKQLGPYTIGEQIGYGRYKYVFSALSHNSAITTTRDVALGVPHIQSEERIREEMARFAPLAVLDHPGLIRVFETGEHDGLRYVVYEYVLGHHTLTDELAALQERSEQLPYDVAVEWAIQLCDTLAYMHDHNVLHCDLSPDTILVTEEHTLKIANVGQAQIRGQKEATNIHYTAPEQITLNAQRASVDIWAAGVIIYQLLTGALPFGEPDDSNYAIRTKILHDVPEAPTLLNSAVPWECSVAVMRALDAQQRYASAREMAGELRRVQSGEAFIPATEEQIALLFRAHCTLLYVVGDDETRAVEMLRRASEPLGARVYTWSLGSGLDTDRQQDRGQYRRPSDVLYWFAGRMGHSEHAILVLKDWHVLLGDPIAVRYLADLYYGLRQRYPSAIVLLSPTQRDLPESLEKKVALIQLDRPDEREIQALIEQTIADLQEDDPTVKSTIEQHELRHLAWQALGMSLDDIDRAIRRSVAKHGALSNAFAEDLIAAKGEIVRTTDLLQFYSSGVSFDDIGGVPVLRKRVEVIGKALQAGYWMPLPRGWLLIGVPGCGKSLAAKAIAGAWRLPLLRFDAARIYGARLGEAEQNMYRVIKLAAKVSPAVLWIDEIEKGFIGGAAGEAGGTVARVFSILLNWLQERKAPVFVVATANTVLIEQDLPGVPGVRQLFTIMDFAPELFRSGRFDDIFFFDLPTSEEREQILHVVLRKHGCPTEHLSLDVLVDAAESMSGVEIEQCIISAWYDALDGGRRYPGTEDIRVALHNSKRLGVTYGIEIDLLRGFGQSVGARWANAQER
jgi:serine/threonine protein kinase/AAA+ superfamily predicted ATPase